MQPIVIVGAGGIGCAIGHALLEAGRRVLMVERNPRKIDSGVVDGVMVVGRTPRPAEWMTFDDWTPTPDATVILCTKCYDNAAVLDRLPASANLIPIQNGFDAALEYRDHAFEGIASFVSECEADRPVTRITRRGKLHLGPRVDRSASHSAELKQLAKDLGRSRLFRVVTVRAIEPYKYSKLMYNAAISPLAAAAGIDNGRLLSIPAARKLFFAFLQENYRILRDAGVELGKIGPFHPRTVAFILRQRWLACLLARAFEPSLRGTYCSMAPDLPRGITEIDNYNQRLVDLAGNRPCPLNRAAVALIKRMERERLPPRLEMLGELETAGKLS